MCIETTVAELKNRCERLCEIVREQNEKICLLENGVKSDSTGKKDIFNYLEIYQRFLVEVYINNWAMERKYRTEKSLNYIDVEFNKYRDFVSKYFDKSEQLKFKDFLVDMQLIDSNTFDSRKKVIVHVGNEKTRVARIRLEVFNWLTKDVAV